MATARKPSIAANFFDFNATGGDRDRSIFKTALDRKKIGRKEENAGETPNATGTLHY